MTKDIIEVLHAAAGKDVEGGFTAAELCKQTGQCDSWVGNKLRKLYAEGRLVVGTKRVKSICGRNCQVPAYRLLPEPNRLTKGNGSRSKQSGDRRSK